MNEKSDVPMPLFGATCFSLGLSCLFASLIIAPSPLVNPWWMYILALIFAVLSCMGSREVLKTCANTGEPRKKTVLAIRYLSGFLVSFYLLILALVLLRFSAPIDPVLL